MAGNLGRVRTYRLKQRTDFDPKLVALGQGPERLLNSSGVPQQWLTGANGGVRRRTVELGGRSYSPPYSVM
ncbi:hypothetical protein GCM10010177_78510 [Actinomadura citrea]|nr:hypothetical protein GCM10010177_78510 [Actinomadura citrea]